jgi:EpsD family peptidyl-prolyl cis-trans isomerase
MVLAGAVCKGRIWRFVDMQGFDRASAYCANRLLKSVLGLSMLTLLAACPNKDKAANTEASQIAAQVNESEISVHQVQTMMQLQPALANQLGEAAAPRILDSLIEQELAAQAARSAGLDSTPKVLQAMELAKREVLARAYQDQLSAKAVMPDTEAVNRYYDAHPELFAKRRHYIMQETQVKASPDQAKALKAKMDALGSVEAVNSLVAQSGLPHSSRSSSQWAEGMAMNLLTQLAYLKNGQSISILTTDGLAILTLQQAEEVPLTLAQATGAIQAALLSTNRHEVVRQGMEALRQQAKIKRLGAFAASTPASAASSADTAAKATSAP